MSGGKDPPRQAEFEHTELDRLRGDFARLKAQLHEVELVYRHAPVGLGLLDPDLRIVHVNDALAAFANRPAADHVGRHVSEVIPSRFEELEPVMRRVMETGVPALNLDVRGAVAPGAGDHVATVSYYPVAFGPEASRGIAVVAHDITERVRAEVELKRANEELEHRVRERTRELTDAIGDLRNAMEERDRVAQELESRGMQIAHLLAAGPAVIYACRCEPPFPATFVSENVLQQIGHPAQRFIDEPGFWTENVHEEDLPRVRDAVQRLFEQGHWTYEYRFRRADGTYCWMRDEMRLVRGEAGVPNFIFGYWIDVTAHKDAETKISGLQADLAHASRVSTIGEMTSGLAHELHQPLQTILNRAFSCTIVLSRSDTEVTKRVRAEIDVIERQALRAVAIIAKLRQYVRKGTPDRTHVRLNELLNEVLTFARSEFSRFDVESVIDLEGDPWVFVDSVQIQQVVLNLIRNSIEAMSEVQSSKRCLEVRTRCPSPDSVAVSFEDFGPVVPDDVLRQASDHFFSTKDTGLGLGLPISESIVKAHEGTLTLRAKPEGGVIACFTLPVPK